MNQAPLTYKELQDMKVGDIYYISTNKVNVRFMVKTLPKESYNKKIRSLQLKWSASVIDDEDLNFLATESVMEYGPFVYEQPASVGVTDIGFK